MKTNHTSLIILACCALFAAGCRAKTFGHSDVTASSGGRDLHASVNGPVWVKPAEDRFSVKLSDHEIVIEKERLLLDKKESAKVPAGAKKFDVVSDGVTLTVTADGVEILKAELKK